jgi:adenylate cyclase
LVWSTLGFAAVVRVDGSSDVELGAVLEIADDPTGDVGFLEADAKLAWTPSPGPGATLGFRESVTWARVAVDDVRTGDEEVYLDHASAQTDRVRVWFTDVEGRVTRHAAGDQIPVDAWPLPGRYPSFLVPRGTARIHLAIDGVASRQLTFSLRTRAAHEAWLLADERAHLALFGALLTVGGLNLLLRVVTRRVVFGLYVGYIASYAAFLAGYSGFFTLGRPPVLAWINVASPWLVLSTAVFLGLFAVRLLRVPIRSWAWWSLLLPPAVMLVGVLAWARTDFRTLGYVGLSAVLLQLLSAVVVGLQARRRGERAAAYYLAGWFGFFIGNILIVARQFGVLPANVLTNYAQQAGSILEALLLSYALSVRLQQSQQAADRTAAALARLVPTGLLDVLGAEGWEALRAGVGQRATLTVLFLDMRGFTLRSERLGAEGSFRFVNDVLAAVVPVIREEGGFVDKFLGDAVLAVFPAEGDAALRAARRLHVAIHAFNAAHPSMDPLAVGIGIHRGEVMFGVVGHDDRVELTTIGDAVNVASRLQSLTKPFRLSTLVSDAAHPGPLAEDMRDLGRIRVRGRVGAIAVREIVDPNTARARRDPVGVAAFEEGLDALAGGDLAHAVARFAEATSLNPRDHVAAAYHRQALRWSVEGLPVEHDGVVAAIV